MSNPGDTEYFICSVQDRLPDVRILRPRAIRGHPPAGGHDEASADDDYGIQRFDPLLVRGRGEKAALPTATPAYSAQRQAHVPGRSEIEPGDFVTQYARARCLREAIDRGPATFSSRSSPTTKSSSPQSQVVPERGGRGTIEALVSAQKDITSRPEARNAGPGAGAIRAGRSCAGRGAGRVDCG